MLISPLPFSLLSQVPSFYLFTCSLYCSSSPFVSLDLSYPLVIPHLLCVSSNNLSPGLVTSYFSALVPFFSSFLYIVLSWSFIFIFFGLSVSLVFSSLWSLLFKVPPCALCSLLLHLASRVFLFPCHSVFSWPLVPLGSPILLVSCISVPVSCSGLVRTCPPVCSLSASSGLPALSCPPWHYRYVRPCLVLCPVPSGPHVRPPLCPADLLVRPLIAVRPTDHQTGRSPVPSALSDRPARPTD